MEQTRRFNILYEILNTTTHGFGFFIAIIAGISLMFHMLSEPVTTLELMAVISYLTTVGFFLLASTLFHALIFTKAAKFFQFFDHAGIYLVTLGTYTPYTLLLIKGWLGWSIWSAIMLMTIAGLTYDFFFVGRWPWLAVTIYLVMGWLIVLAVPVLWQILSPLAFWLLVAGGMTYSAGTFFYLTPKIPMGHVYWHVFVLVCSALMFFSLYLSL